MKRRIYSSGFMATLACLCGGLAYGGVTINSNPTDHVTIQAAINAAASGDTINVTAGTYNENITINKHVDIVGAGSGVGGTVITSPGTQVVSLAASGNSAVDPIALSNLRVVPQANYGINVAVVDVDYVSLNNVHVVGPGATALESEVGLKVATSTSLRHVVVAGCAFTDCDYGWYFAKHGDWGPGGSVVEDIVVTNSVFNDNDFKAIYAEKLSETSFDGCEVKRNGDASFWNQTWNGGIDINLKGGETYQNISILNSVFEDNGLGYKEGAAIMIKARDDGGTYGAHPAALDGVIITGNTITGNERGIRFGEPGKANLTPTSVTLSGNTIIGNVQTYVDSGSGPGSAYGDVVNATGIEVAGIPIGSSVIHVVTNTTQATTYDTLEDAVAAANANDTLTIAGNINLTQTITVSIPLTIDGGNKATTRILGNSTAPGVAPDRNFMEFTAGSAGSTVKNITFEKTDKAGVQNMIAMLGDNLTFDNCNFTGQYVVGDGDVSRAFVMSGTGFMIKDCSIVGLRQPAYINPGASGGTIQDTYTARTKGWVVDGALVTFTNNTWGQGSDANATDIALLATPAHPTPYNTTFYDPLISNLSANNNNARIENQRAEKATNVTQGLAYATIQAAIDGAVNGDFVEVYAGTFNESVTLNKDITLQGSGIGQTIINGAGSVFTIPAAGSGASVSGLTVSGGSSGFMLNGASNVILDGVAADGLTSYGISLSGVNNDITLKNSSFSNNTSSGIKVPSTSKVNTLIVDNCTVDGNRFGIYAADGNAATYQANVQLNGITITDSTFSNNSDKGMYIESMSDALFERLEVVGSGNGTSGGSGSGIDINLKYAAYSNITIRDSLIKGCGTNYSFGGGLLIKARSTGSYSTNQATLGGTILLEGLRVENNGLTNAGSGIRIGDATDETSPTNVTIQNSKFSGNDTYAIYCLVQGATITATHNHWDSATGPISAVTNGIGVNPASTVTYSPWYVTSDGSTPPALSDLLSGIVEDVTISTPVAYGDLYIAPGTTITVTEAGSLEVVTGKIELADGAELIVNGGSLEIGDGSVISGTFTIFNSFGSWSINGDTTFNIGQTLALISDIHVAGGTTLTVNGGGELVLDGCVMDSQTPGTTYNINVEAAGFLKMARCMVTDAVIDIDTVVTGNSRSLIYDSTFITSDIEAVNDNKVYHNLFEVGNTHNSGAGPTDAFDDVDGWGNVTDANALENRFSLNFVDSSTPLNGHTLDSQGNLFVKSTDAVSMTLDISQLGSNPVTALEALLGYNSDLLTLIGTVTPAPADGPIPAWQVIQNTHTPAVGPNVFGLVDSALGFQLNAGGTGETDDMTAGTVNFTALADGATYGFFRVQTDNVFDGNGVLLKDTRLTKYDAPSSWSHLSAFTSNSGTLVIDSLAPEIAAASAATQDQPSNTAVDVLNSFNPLFRQGANVMVTFTATDNGHGLAGVDETDHANDLVVKMEDPATTVHTLAAGTDYNVVSATESNGIVTYTLSIDPLSTAIDASGTYKLSADVRDRSGNWSVNTQLSTFLVQNEALVNVELQGFAGTQSRVVTFVATGGTYKTWTKTVSNFNSTNSGSVILEDVPAGTTHISAKTAWNLRSKVTLSNAVSGTANCTGGDYLPGGDITGDNVINTLDYSQLSFEWGSTTATISDIDGNGSVVLGDYNIFVANFYTAGDPE